MKVIIARRLRALSRHDGYRTIVAQCRRKIEVRVPLVQVHEAGGAGDRGVSENCHKTVDGPKVTPQLFSVLQSLSVFHGGVSDGLPA